MINDYMSYCDMGPILSVIVVWIIACDAFAPVQLRPIRAHRLATTIESEAVGSDIDAKTIFLDTLDRPYDLNEHGENRSNLLNALVDSGAGLSNPGSTESFASVAPGVWRVVYAPHMTTIAGLFHGELSVQVSWNLFVKYQHCIVQWICPNLYMAVPFPPMKWSMIYERMVR